MEYTAPIEISSKLRPKSADEEAKRAYFLCRELETRYSSYLQSVLLDHKIIADPDVFNDCVKLMTWTTIYITGIRCGALDARPWVLDFLTCAMRLADDLVGESQTMFYLDDIGGLTEEPIVYKAACAVALKLRVMDSEFVGTTQAKVEQACDEAKDILDTALSLPLDSLRDLLRLMSI